jgi:hypothetical protein
MVVRQGFSWVLLVGLLGLAPAAIAGMVTTEQVAASVEATQAREHLKTLAQRPELAKEMQALGIAPEQAQARVDAMTDAEVVALAGKLDSLPAGGALSNNDLILVLLIVILIIAL